MRQLTSAPAIGLFFLAPLVGEFLLGNVSAAQWPALVVLAPMYGGGAILVRELTRRTGLGWPTMIVLSAAYGLIEAGLVDQTLFNPPDVAPGNAFIPALGFSADNALSFIGGHVIWSIGAPIALIEAFVPDRRTTPWLGKVGLSIAGVLYLVGCVFVFRFMYRTEHFIASPWQLLGTAAVALALIGVAFTLRRPHRTSPGWVPRPWLLGSAVFVLASLYFLFSGGWAGVVFQLSVLTVSIGALAWWSSREGWNARHRLAVAGALLMTYAWGGFVLSTLKGNSLIGNAVLTAAAVVLLVFAARAVRRDKR